MSGCRSPESVVALSNSARQSLETSDYDRALDSVRKARALKPRDPTEAAQLRLLEAEILIYAQKEDAGLTLLAQPLEKEAQALIGRQALLVGTAVRRKSNWPEAKKQLERALAAARQSGDRATEVMAGVQWATGMASERRWPEATEALRRASAVASALGHPYLEDVVRFNQATVLMRRGEADRSIELYRIVAEGATARRNPVMFASSLDNMAVNYQRVGDYERALEYNQKALEAFEKPPHLPVHKVQSYGSRGSLLFYMGRPAEAAGELARALALARQVARVDLVQRWAGNLIPVLLALDRVDEAERLAAELMALDPLWPYSLASNGLVRERRGRLAEARRNWETVLAQSNCPDQVRLDATFGLARLHVAANQPVAAKLRYREALKLVDDAWGSLRTDDSRLTFLTSAMDVYRSFVSALVRWGDEGEALRAEESSRARLLGNQEGHASPRPDAAVLARLAAQTRSVFLAYWLAPEGGSHVRVFAAGRSTRSPLPAVEPGEITRLVRDHNDLLERRLEDPREKGIAAARLYDLLVKPVAALIPPGSRVVVIPDAALHRLNFETLVRVKGGQKGFWIEDVVLQVAPSLSLLNTRPMQPAAGQRLLLIGDALAAPEFGRLDHAAAEMTAIRNLFGGQAGVVNELTAEAATPSAYVAAAPGAFTHIHFTAHAKANRESPLDSAVILTPEPAAGGDVRYRLLAREVAAIELHADLVTVSACRSAGDRAVSGEGMVGLAWAFQRAGAGNVVAGLWDVNDRSTAKLMGELYAGIRAGKPVAEALRAAKLSFIAGGKNYAKPYYWAPFQVYSRSLPSPGH